MLRVWSVLDILTWNKRDLEEKYINSGYTTALDIYSPGNLWFDWKQIATVLILPQCNSMMYLK